MPPGEMGAGMLGAMCAPVKGEAPPAMNYS
jgi:hypothetical protein